MERKSSAIDRRKFLSSLAVLSAIPFIPGCKESLSTEAEKLPDAELTLSGDEQTIASGVRKQFQKIQQLYDNPGKEFVVEYQSGRSSKLLGLSFTDNNAASYKHLLVRDINGNRSVNVTWGMKGIFPSIKFSDNSGNVLVINGTEMEFAIKSENGETSSPKDWLTIGIKIFAVALAIWLGATVAKYIVAAVAFLAFNAMVIGLLLIGAAVLLPLLKLILNLTGWTINTITDLFSLSIELLLSLLLEIQAFILNYGG